MIKKAFLYALLLLVAYAAFVAWFAPPWWSAAQGTEQDNIIKAQSFIYNKKTDSQVIVGSSLSCRIVTDSLPGTFNLGFGGQSIYDGLNLITHKQALPRVVFIEMNMVLVNEKKAFTSALFSPLMYYPKKNIQALREDKEPLVISGKVIQNSIYALKDWVRGTHTTQKKQPINAAPVQSDSTAALSGKMVNDTYMGYFKLPKQSEIDRSFNELKKYTGQLEKKGVKVIFFEMPIDNRLVNLPRPVFIRNQFYTVFPRSAYQYIDRPKWSYCDTFDGLHLSEQEAVRYTRYFKSQYH